MGRAKLPVFCVAWLGSLAVALAPVGSLIAAGERQLPPGARTSESDARIAQLIAELGAEQYVRREKAQDELRRLGVGAFEALLDAQNHEDIEIALRARYLLRSMPIRWTEEGDPPEAKSLLQSYGDVNREERKSRIAQLASLEESVGAAALCRLMRFELDRTLSKEAALLLIHHVAPSEEQARRALAAKVRSAVGASTRPAARWLMAYATSLETPENALSDAERIVRDEEAVLARFPEETDRRIVRELWRWQTGLLLSLARRDEANAALRRMLDWVQEDRQELFDLLDWSLDRQAWSVADEVAERFPRKFEEDPLLLYRWAEARRKGGKTSQAEDMARRALSIEPDRHERHIEAARRLNDRLLYDWAERELRQVVAATNPQDTAGLEARFFLADLLFDLQKELASAEVLQDTINSLAKDAKVLQEFTSTLADLRARMHYRFAMHFHRAGDVQKEREQLEEAIRQDPDEVDVLIAMYRYPAADGAWKDMTKKRMAGVVERTIEHVRRYEEMADDRLNPRMRSEVAAPLALLYNQLAWLISNTEGDLKQALSLSQKSLELAPGTPAYLDTLGRCYYALGDFSNAVKYQTRAVKLEPYTQQMRRQLELFQGRLEESRQGAAPGPVRK